MAHQESVDLRARRRSLSRAELALLPPLVDVPTAGMVPGVGRSATYELVRSGRWPTRVVRLGRRIVIPTAPLLDLVGVDVAGADGTTRDFG